MKRKFFIAIALALLIVSVCFSRELGELHLEGEYVERLVLRRKDGPTQSFDHPGETVRLPAGEYRLQDVRLKGGYTYRSLGTSTYKWVTVDEDKPAAFKVGAPLKQTVKMQRQGPLLVINYELTGAGGETYNSVINNSKRPMFTVFKGDKEVATGEFEFG